MQKLLFEIENHVLKTYHGHDRNLILPETVKEIGDSAFRNYTRLQSITLPEGLTRIGKSAFWGCRNLKSITLPESLSEIEGCAFHGCRKLKAFSVPEQITTIREYTFTGCYRLQSIHLPAKLTTIEACAFSYCKSLKEIQIPENVITIGCNAFAKCRKLKNLTFSAGTASTGLEIENGILKHYHGKEHQVIIPSMVTAIDKKAFEHCRSIREVIIPNSVTSIGEMAFRNTTLRKIIIPDSVSEIGADAFLWNEKLKDIILPDNIFIHIGQGAFTGTFWFYKQFPKKMAFLNRIYLRSLTDTEEITLPEDTAAIADRAFQGCYKLKRIISLYGTFPPEDAELLSNVLKLFSADLSQEYQKNQTALFFHDMFLHLIKNHYPETIQKILETKRFSFLLTREEVDKLIQFATENQKHECYVLLLNYKQTVIGYESIETTIRKKFSL